MGPRLGVSTSRALRAPQRARTHGFHFRACHAPWRGRTDGNLVGPIQVFDLIINLADSATLLSTVGSVATNGSPNDVNLMLTQVPCLVCFEPSVEVVVNIDPRTENITVTGGSIDLDLAEVTVIIDAAGLELILSNVGNDPACAWANDSPPSVSLGPPAP